MKIYTKFGKQDTIYKFIKKLYSNIESSGAHAQGTYMDEKCTIMQCYSNKLRSFDDLLYCVQTYYPHCTPQYLMHILLTVNIKSIEGKPLYLYVRNCISINRINCYYYYQEAYSNIDCLKYNSKWSWRELFNMLELKTTEDIKNYVKKYKE